MENRVLLRIISATVFIATIAISYICFPDTYFSNGYLIASSLLLGVSLASAFFGAAGIEKDRTNAGLLSSMGVQGFFGFLMAIVSALALFFAGFGGNVISGVLDVLAVIAFVLTLTLGKLTKQTVNHLTEKIEFKSAHLGWYEQLKFLSETTTAQATKATLMKLAESARYLTRDLDADGLPINDQIRSGIAQLEAQLASSDFVQVETSISSLESLFKRREVDISSARRKA